LYGLSLAAQFAQSFLKFQNFRKKKQKSEISEIQHNMGFIDVLGVF